MTCTESFERKIEMWDEEKHNEFKEDCLINYQVFF